MTVGELLEILKTADLSAKVIFMSEDDAVAVADGYVVTADDVAYQGLEGADEGTFVLV